MLYTFFKCILDFENAKKLFSILFNFNKALRIVATTILK